MSCWVFQPSVIIRNVTSLLERLRWLLDELLPWETRLEKARFDAKIRLKKEHDEIIHKATTGNAYNAVDFRGDPWEEEICNKVSFFCWWMKIRLDHDCTNVFA